MGYGNVGDKFSCVHLRCTWHLESGRYLCSSRYVTDDFVHVKVVYFTIHQLVREHSSLVEVRVNIRGKDNQVAQASIEAW